ncbi:MAG: hypothetical protein M1821_008943 [Bathelium mastoideum]|nr:MAG: hypothetical protein M1821_008943 [Bathelium mastoideum]
MSFAVHMGPLPFMSIILWWPYVFRLMPQLWRLFSSFLLTGPKIGLILDPYFLYKYGRDLEVDSPRFAQPGDFFTYVTFLWAVILFTDGYLLSGYEFLHCKNPPNPRFLARYLTGLALLMGFTYTYAQDDPARLVSFFIVTFQAKWLPYAMLAISAIAVSPAAALHQSTGLLAAHLYEFLTRIWPEHGNGRNVLQTPAFVLRWFGADQRRPRVTSAGTAFAAQPRTQSASTSGAGQSSGVGLGNGPQAWARRGPGHRLGGE